MVITSSYGKVVRDVPPIVDMVVGDKAKAPVVDNAVDVDDVEEVQLNDTPTLVNPKSDCASKNGEGSKSNSPNTPM